MSAGWMGGWHADATWLGWAGSRIVSIGQMRPGLTALAIGLAVLAIVEAGYILYLRRKAGAGGGPMADRLDHLAAALNLLTDTTESGLTALAVEIQRVQARQASPRAPRGAKTRGASIKTIAATEAVSEDEVQLHAALAGGFADAKGL